MAVSKIEGPMLGSLNEGSYDFGSTLCAPDFLNPPCGVYTKSRSGRCLAEAQRRTSQTDSDFGAFVQDSCYLDLQGTQNKGLYALIQG